MSGMESPTIVSEQPAAPARRIRLADRSPASLAIASALLLWLAFPPVSQSLLAWFALVPLVGVVESDRRPWRVYLGTWLGGLVFWHLAIGWVCEAAPTAWVGWTIMATFLSLGWLLFLALARLGRKTLGLPIVAVVPVAWLVEEYYRSFAATGFPWYFVGQTQSRFLALIQCADLAGVWGVSCLVVLANAALGGLLLAWDETDEVRRRSELRKASRIAAGTVVLLVAALGYGAWRLGTARFVPGPRIAVLQSDIPQELKMANDPDDLMAEFHRLADRAVRDRPELIVWPETAYPRGYPVIHSDLPEPEFVRQLKSIHPDATPDFWREKVLVVRGEIHDWVDRLGVPMVVGVTTYEFRTEGLRKYNSAVLFEPGRTTTASYHKQHLVPFGEYVPLIETMPWLVDLTPYEPGYIPSLNFGPDPTTFEHNGRTYATAICFEDTVPRVVRAAFRSGRPPDVLLNISNDGWFRGSSEPAMHLIAGVFRAVEHRVPLARAANTGGSSFVDGNGRILAVVPDRQAGALTVALPLDPRTSLYTRLGDWLPQLAVALAVAGVAMIPLRRSRGSV